MRRRYTRVRMRGRGEEGMVAGDLGLVRDPC